MGVMLRAIFGFLGDSVRRWRLRPYDGARSEMERLAAVRAYAAWVRDMPPPPVRTKPQVAVVPIAENPPIRGVIEPFPGRRIAGR
jgi:hypothetical protein